MEKLTTININNKNLSLESLSVEYRTEPFLQIIKIFASVKILLLLKYSDYIKCLRCSE